MGKLSTFGLSGFAFLSWLFLPDFFGFFISGCLASAARQAQGKHRGAVGNCRTGA
jgi:hypothetical protein